jgi:hypothetical protein
VLWFSFFVLISKERQQASQLKKHPNDIEQSSYQGCWIENGQEKTIFWQ